MGTSTTNLKHEIEIKNSTENIYNYMSKTENHKKYNPVLISYSILWEKDVNDENGDIHLIQTNQIEDINICCTCMYKVDIIKLN